MATPRSVTQELNSIFLFTRERVDREITDIATPDYTIFKVLEENGGITQDTQVGRDLVRDVHFQNTQNVTVLSKSTGIVNRAPVESQHTTQASYPPIMALVDGLISEYDWDNTKDRVGQIGLVEQCMLELDNGLDEFMIDVLWNGYTSGSEHLPGLLEIIQFDPSSDPASGAIGGLSVADYPTWANVHKNYNDEYVTYDSGARIRDFLFDGTNSLSQAYKDCSNVPGGKQSKNQPDLILVNDPLDLMMQQLAANGRMFRDQKASEMLGRTAFRFENAVVVWDRYVPDSPGDASYGTAFLLNTNFYQWHFYAGLKRKWGELIKLTDRTAWQATEKTQMAATVRDRRRMGVQYNIKPLS